MSVRQTHQIFFLDYFDGLELMLQEKANQVHNTLEHVY